MSKIVKIESSNFRMGCGQFNYFLSCGHAQLNADARTWRNGVLTQPKSMTCPLCKTGEHPIMGYWITYEQS